MKKAIFLILVLALCLGLCACGEGQTADDRYAKYKELLQYLENGEYDKAEEYIQNLYETTPSHSHTWKDATCDTPKTCQTCGETEGEKLEHQWKRDTCTEPHTCASCNATNGEGDKHTIQEDICKVCQKPLAEIEKEPAYQYQLALEILSKNKHKNEDYEKAYQLFTNLGDYKDAKEYLGRFTILPDMRLEWIFEDINAFGEHVYTYNFTYGYDQKGNLAKKPDFDYFIRDFAIWLSPDAYTEYRYDDNGRLVEEVDGSWISQYEYNAQGKLVKITEKTSSATGSVTSFTYNEQGQCIKKEVLDADGTSSCVEYTYDSESGLCIKEDEYIHNTHYYTEYKYDDEGRILQRKTWHVYSAEIINLEDYEYYTYDEEGKCVKVSAKSPLTLRQYTCEYIYENDRVIAAKCTTGDQVTVTNYIYGDYYCYTPAK